MDLTTEKALTDLMDLIIQKCLTGAENIAPEALMLLGVLAVIDLAWILCMSVLGSGEDIFYTIVKRGIKYGIYSWLISNWASGLKLTKDIFDFFAEMGAKAAGVTEYINDPSVYALKGIQIALSIFDSIYSLGIGSMGVILLNLLIGISIFLALAAISIHIFTTVLSFYIISTLTTILLPFGVVKQLAFLAEKAIGSIFSLGVKMLALQFILCLVSPFLASLAPINPNSSSIAEALKILIGCAGTIFLSIRTPGLAQDLLSGSPSFGNDTGGSMISRGSNMAKSAVTKPMGMVGMVQAAVQGEGGRNANGKISIGGVAQNMGRMMRQKMPDRQSEHRNKVALWQSLNRKK